MFEETGGGGFVETEGGEKRDEAKVRQFARLLEAVHRLIYTKDDVGLAGGVGLDEGVKVEVRENSGGKLVGEEFYILGRGERTAKIEIRQVDRAKESIVGDDRVEEDVDGRKRSDGRRSATTRSAQCCEHDGLRPSCSSAGGREGGEKRGTTSPSPRGCSTWRGRGRGGRDRGSGKFRRA